MQLPADFAKECSLVGVDLADLQPRHLAPGFCRVVAVLEILGGQDEGSEEHAPTTHEGARGRTVIALLHGEIALGYVRFDEDEVVQCHLQRRVAGTRSLESLFDVSAQRQDAATVVRFVPAGYH